MQCSATRERISKVEHGPGHDKKVVNWDAIQKAEREKAAQKKRKIRARKRRSAYKDFIETAFHGKREIGV